MKRQSFFISRLFKKALTFKYKYDKLFTENKKEGTVRLIHTSYPIFMEIAGNSAMWTRPDTGDSPCSYPAPTYSAVKAMFESILWGPAIIVIPHKVEICAPIQYHNYTCNYGGPLRSSKNIKGGDNYQLCATVLIDVCYRLYAYVMPNNKKSELPEKALAWDGRTTSPGHAYQAMFNRRLSRGQSYAILAMGWKEFTSSYFGPFRDTTEVCSDMPDIPIPSMLRTVFPDTCKSGFKAIYDTDLIIHQGVLVYPNKEFEI